MTTRAVPEQGFRDIFKCREYQSKALNQNFSGRMWYVRLKAAKDSCESIKQFKL